MDQLIDQLSDSEKKIYSQNGEDGVLEKIFSIISTTNKYYVEFGVQNGTECNTKNLRVNHGFNGLLLDNMNEDEDINLHKEFITAENVLDIFQKYDVPFTFDLLSIDIDYNDWWVWKRIGSIYKPRVVVIEYNASHKPSQNKIVKYNKNAAWDHTNYFGASIEAMYKLGRYLGYNLVYAESKGVNLFFVRQDIAPFQKNTNNVSNIYKMPKYGTIDNGYGHRNDPYNREYLNSEDVLSFYKNIPAYETKRGKFYIMPNDEFIGKRITNGISWDETIIQIVTPFIENSRTILDIGSHVGTHAISYANICKNYTSHIHCFEIQPVIYRLLYQNSIENFSNHMISLHNNAIGHLNNITVSISDIIPDGESQNKKISYDTDNKINYGGIRLGKGTISVNMRTIDSYNFENVDFMKIDVEGSEQLVFYGAQHTITKYKPVILYENRSDKQITKEMMLSMDIPEKVLNFSISKFLSDLGYIIYKQHEFDYIMIHKSLRV